MEERNVEYLANEMFYTGFGEIPKEALVKAMDEAIKNGKEKFQLIHNAKINNDGVKALLNFKQSDKNPQMYFYNSFDLLLKKEGKEETLQQNFPTSYGNRYTLKEGYNLLDGRSVHKNFIKFDPEDRQNRKEYDAWVHLDFKESDKYGNYLVNKTFNYYLEKKLEEYPVKGMEYQQNRSQLVNSIAKGNRVSVIMETSRGEEKMFIEAAPRYGSINLYDENNKPLRLSPLSLKQGQGQDVDQSVTQAETKVEVGRKNRQEKNGAEDNVPENPGEKKTAKRRVKM